MIHKKEISKEPYTKIKISTERSRSLRNKITNWKENWHSAKLLIPLPTT